MNIRFNMSSSGVLLLLYSIWNTVIGIQLTDSSGRGGEVGGIIVVILIFMWISAIAQFTFSALEKVIAFPLRLGRHFPTLYWILLLAYVSGGLVYWILLYHPAAGKVSLQAQFYIQTWGWLLIFALSYGFDREQFRLSMKKLDTWTSGMMIVLTVLLVMLLGGELMLRMFFVRSDSGMMTLSSNDWFKVFWEPVNSLGYRDYEIDTTRDESTQRVLVVGDSFVAGNGTENIDKTFPHLLKQKLDDNFTVNIVAKPNWDTVAQFNALRKYPLEPDLVILSYMLNDIERAAFENGMRRPSIVEVPEFFESLAQNFYIASYVRFIINTGWLSAYSENMLSAFSDDAAWHDHQVVLDALVNRLDSQDAHLVVLIWPFLDAPDISEEPARLIEQFFEQQGVPVINMLDVIVGEPPLTADGKCS